MNVSAYRKKTRTVTVEFDGGEQIVVTYLPGALTIENIERFSAAEKDDSAGAAAELVAQLISGWDLSWEEGGEPIPATPAELAQVPLPILAAVVEAIKDDALPNAGRPGR
jgi:hypothetical protein